MSELLIEKWPGLINTVTIGATKEEGGTRLEVAKVGGQNTLPFLLKEGRIPNKPIVAYEVLDSQPLDWQCPFARLVASGSFSASFGHP